MSLAHWQKTFTDTSGNVRAGLSVEIRDELQMLPPGQLFIEIGAIRDITCYPFDRVSLFNHIVAIDHDGTPGRDREACHDTDRRRLSRPVRTEKAVYFALTHLEVDPIDGREVAIALGKFRNGYHQRRL